MNAKRGYAPEDEKNFSPSALETLRTAAGHVDYLINNGYDLKQASTFVGNHFLLSERQRLAITRSLATKVHLKSRREKEKANLAGGEAWIDGFNTIITLEVLLSDSVLFRCMRDKSSKRNSKESGKNLQQDASASIMQQEQDFYEAVANNVYPGITMYARDVNLDPSFAAKYRPKPGSVFRYPLFLKTVLRKDQ